MSNEIKVGDKVRVRKDAPRMYLRTMSTKFLGAECGVFEIIDGNAAIASGRDYIAIPLKYLVKVNAEKKEAKFKKGDRIKFKNIYELQKVKDKSFGWMLAMFASKEATITAVENNGFYRVDIDPSIGGINDDMIECKVESTEAEKKPNVGSIKIPVEVDLSDSYWDAYAADLSKDIAVKLADNTDFINAKEKAAYVVKYAREIVENLKK